MKTLQLFSNLFAISLWAETLGIICQSNSDSKERLVKGKEIKDKKLKEQTHQRQSALFTQILAKEFQP